MNPTRQRQLGIAILVAMLLALAIAAVITLRDSACRPSLTDPEPCSDGSLIP